MKGVHPDKGRANRKRSSLRDTARCPAEAEPECRGRNPWLRNDGPNASEPIGSPVRIDVMAEPLVSRRRQHAPRKCSTKAAAHITGETGTARREGNATNVGDLDRCNWRLQPRAQGRKPRSGGRREVGRVRSTSEGGESRWREGALLDEANLARKERGLWQH